MKPMTVFEFMQQYPDDNACLDHLMHKHYGDTSTCTRCGKHGKFHRIKKHPAYACAWCGNCIYPMKGTIFAGSHTPLQKWYYAIYLFTTTRHGVPAKELQRQLGVAYQTAWSMGHKIREYIADTDGENPLDGDVEVDETYVGGKASGGKRGRGAPNKTIAFGMLDRDGDVMTKVVPNVKKRTLQPIIQANVKAGSTVHSDELRSYKGLDRAGYTHKRVNHGTGKWVSGGSHVNSIEGFWARLKLSIRGTHIHVSKHHLPKYLKEFEFRYNYRNRPEKMLPDLLEAL